MVIGDIPPLLCVPGLLGPRGPCCIPLSTSSKPIVLSRVPARSQTITARYDSYKARKADRGATGFRWAANTKFCYRTCRSNGGTGMILDKPIGVAGAGSIGCFVRGMYAAAGHRVALLARPRVIGEIESNGLRLTSFEGFDRRIAPNQLTLSEDPPILGDVGGVRATGKPADTAKSAGR